MKLWKALQIFWEVLWGKDYLPSDEVQQKIRELENQLATIKNTKGTFDPQKGIQEKEEGAILTLQLLQKQSRLIDFLMEDISRYPDAQVSAAVRRIHQEAKKTIDEHFTIKPILNQKEGDPWESPEINPQRIQLYGTVPEHPPYRGRVLHPGWYVEKLKLPLRTQGYDPSVIQAAAIRCNE